MGRSFSQCKLIKGGDLADTEVVYQITEGPKVKVRDIRFTGNTFVSGARLATQIKSSHEWYHLIGGTYNKQMVDADIGELYKYYRGFGYQDVRISVETQRSANDSEITLIFHIQEGIRYKVQDVPDVHGSQTVPREQLIPSTSFKPGDYLDESKLKADQQSITRYLGYNGQDAKVEAIPVWIPDTPGVCKVRYEVNERPPARVGQISIQGNMRTKGDVEGDGVFKDSRVDVNEANTGSLIFGVGVNSNSGLIGNIVPNERDFDIFYPPCF